MELNELKKSWNKLNEHLEQTQLVDEKALSLLITQYTTQTKGHLNKIAGLGKVSVLLGGGFIVLLLVLCIVLPYSNLPREIMERIVANGIFFGITLIGGLLWDLKTYYWIRNTRIEEMPVVKVITRINRFRSWMKYEIIALSIWLIPLMFLTYYTFELYNLPFAAQAVAIGIWIITFPLIIYYIYKKQIYDNLQEIKKNLDELKELKKDPIV